MSGPSVKIPADWLDSDHIEDLGADVILLMLTALGHSARQVSEGLVPRRALRKLWPVDDIDDAVARLIKAGEVEDQGDKLLFVRWQQFILDKSEVDAIKEKNRVRDERRRKHNNGDHSMCLPRYCKDAPRENTRETTRGLHVSPRVSHADPYLSDPDRPLGREGEGEGTSAATRSAGATRDAAAPPIGITRVSQIVDEPGDSLRQHVEILIGIDHEDPYQHEASWSYVEQVLKQVQIDITRKHEDTKEKCGCWPNQLGNECSTDVVAAVDNEDQGPELSVCVPAGDFTRWEGIIKAALKNATALANWERADGVIFFDHDVPPPSWGPGGYPVIDYPVNQDPT